MLKLLEGDLAVAVQVCLLDGLGCNGRKLVVVDVVANKLLQHLESGVEKRIQSYHEICHTAIMSL